MTFDEAERYLYSFVDWEKSGGRPTESNDLMRFRGFLRAVGDPQSSYDVVHVVGTNGKGSVSAMLAAILAERGHRVGLFTSPHLVSVRERIQIDGVPIGESAFADTIHHLKQVADKVSLGRGGYRTTFELLTALALLHFRHCDATIAVVEAGLGGRLDTTAVLDPRLTLVTPIHLDHTATLGKTLRAISEDKTAVIRSGIPLVTAAQPAAVRAVLTEAVLRRRPSCWVRLGHEATYRSWAAGDGYRGAGFGLGDRRVTLRQLPLRGRHQAANAAMAVAAALIVDPASSTQSIQRGLSKTRWPGRLDAVYGAPLLLLEGAHNPHAAHSLAAFLTEWEEAKTRPATLLVAISKGKDVLGILRPLLAHASSLTACCPVPTRSLPAECVAELATNLGFNAVAEPDPQKALRVAERRVGRDGLVVVFGSLYLVGSVAKTVGADHRWWSREEPTAQNVHDRENGCILGPKFN